MTYQDHMVPVDPNNVTDPTPELKDFNEGFVSIVHENMKLKETSFYVDLNQCENVYKKEEFIYRCRWPGGGSITTRIMKAEDRFQYVPDMRPPIVPIELEPPNKKSKIA